MSVRVVRPGLLTTVQDRGRYGYQRHGIVVGGAMDAHALRIVNLLVGNEPAAAGLEVTLIGPTLEFESDHTFALGGGDLGGRLDGQPVAWWRPCHASAGALLTFTGARAACRAYIAFAGGIDVPQVLGSRSTDVRAGIGGVEGRALVAGDRLEIGAPSSRARRLEADLLARNRLSANWGAGPSLLPRWTAEPVIRVIRGPEYDAFSPASHRALFESAFQVSAQSDRMGYRLQGPQLALASPLELLSSPIVEGMMQVPPGGDPIVLMADRQTVGGYPRIVQVITVDLPLLAQSVPGARVRFREVGLNEAQALYLARERDLRQLSLAISMRYPGES